MKNILNYLKSKAGIKMIICLSVIILLGLSLLCSIRYLSGSGSNYEFKDAIRIYVYSFRFTRTRHAVSLLGLLFVSGGAIVTR